MSLLSARGLVKAYGGSPVLDGIEINVRERERLGLVGNNGCGKSTLARILAGLEPVDEGTLAQRRGSSVVYLAQNPTWDEGLTVREVAQDGLRAFLAAKERYDRATRALEAEASEHNLEEQAEAAADVERAGGWDAPHRAEGALTKVGLGELLDRPWNALSGGERRRLALARLLVMQPSLAILDEPSNHLDIETIEWLEEFLGAAPFAFLLITHDRFLLDRVVDATLELSGAKLHRYEGGYERYLEAKAIREDLAERMERTRQNLMRRELEWLRRQPKARTGKQKARIDRAESMREAGPPKTKGVLSMEASTVRQGKIVMDLRGVSLSMGGKRLIHGLDLLLSAGERLGIVGPNGVGKTTLIRAMLGEVEPDEGEIVRGSTIEIAYFDQHKTALDPERSILDNVADGRQTVPFGGRPVEARSYLERFLFAPTRQTTPVGALSGGEQARVALAKLLSSPANVVILDEPTNDLDVGTLSALEELLLDYPGTVLAVTHDRYFLNRIATGVLAFEGDGRVIRYAGGYDDFVAQRTARREAEALEANERPATKKDTPTPASADADEPSSPALKPLTYAERKELDGLMERVEAAEAEVSRIEGLLSDPATYATDGGALGQSLTAELERAKAAAAELTDRWAELEERAELAVKPGRKR